MLEPWDASVELSDAEKRLLKVTKKQPLWSFLRRERHQLLNEDVRATLRDMFASSGRGRAVCPERLALALILQVALHVSDQDVPMLTAADRLWRMVLGSLDAEEDVPLFSQGTVFNFRERAREHGLMDVLLERTVALARETGGFSHKRLRAMIDSSPLVGAGRVEDTFNLIGRALSRLVDVSAREAGRSVDELAAELSLSVVSAKSVKAALDADWRLPNARQDALQELLGQVNRVRHWLQSQVPPLDDRPDVAEALQLVEQLIEQDTEPDPEPGADPLQRRIRKGGADRIVSVSDPEMRHGRKTKTKLFVGYKRHVIADADVPGLVVGVHIAPANRREFDACGPLFSSAEGQGLILTEVHADRGYLPSPELHERRQQGLVLISKPPTPQRRPGRFSKQDFEVLADATQVRCPAGRTVAVVNYQAAFPRKGCTGCPLTDRCLPKSGRRTVRLHQHEQFHRQMAAELSTPAGRQQRRERVVVEHVLARFGAVQGTKARYCGLAKNLFHAKAVAVVANLFVMRTQAEAA
jgi:IS5 family transposase